MMKVILLQDVRTVGKKYDVKQVSDGYARNFLFPNNLAKEANATALREITAHKANLAVEDLASREHIQHILRLLADRHFEFSLLTNEKGNVFGSVTSDAIQKALRSSGLLGKERVEVHLEHPIKAFGEFKIPLRFSRGISATLTIIVRPQP